METKYTPGPWRIGDAGHAVFGPPNGNPSPETIAAKIYKRQNARLIAAAPELLAALEWALPYAEREHEQQYPGETYPKDGNVAASVAAAREAIAKAKGE